jgi:hypothetical protein
MLEARRNGSPKRVSENPSLDTNGGTLHILVSLVGRHHTPDPPLRMPVQNKIATKWA